MKQNRVALHRPPPAIRVGKPITLFLNNSFAKQVLIKILPQRVYVGSAKHVQKAQMNVSGDLPEYIMLNDDLRVCPPGAKRFDSYHDLEIFVDKVAGEALKIDEDANEMLERLKMFNEMLEIIYELKSKDGDEPFPPLKKIILTYNHRLKVIPLIQSLRNDIRATLRLCCEAISEDFARLGFGRYMQLRETMPAKDIKQELRNELYRRKMLERYNS